MSKALATFGTGKLADCLAISRPFFEAYAARHGYAYIEQESVPIDRPASWGKVPLLLDLLEDYDEVLWLDCDVVIVDGSEDFAAQVFPDAWQAMIIHRVHLGFFMGDVPSCGAWLVRPPMIPILEQAWLMTQYTDHPWWEQAALHELLGFRHNGNAIFPVMRGPATELRQHTQFLGDEWNSVDIRNRVARPRLMHMAGLTPHERLREMRFWAGKALA